MRWAPSPRDPITNGGSGRRLPEKRAISSSHRGRSASKHRAARITGRPYRHSALRSRGSGRVRVRIAPVVSTLATCAACVYSEAASLAHPGSPIMFKLILLIALVMGAMTSVTARAQERITLVPHISEGFGIESVVPEDWVDVGGGIVARQASATDATLLAQQSAPAPKDDVLTSLLPQLGLSEPPESTGTHQGGAPDWTLYEVETLGISTDWRWRKKTTPPTSWRSKPHQTTMTRCAPMCSCQCWTRLRH